MTLGVAYGNNVSNLAQLLGEREDRKLLSRSPGHTGASPSFEAVKLTDDPSGGANYSGGSDWVPGMPLTSSNAGLASTRDVPFGAMSYYQAMDWTPSPMTEKISALRAGAGRAFEGMHGDLGESQSFNPVWLALGVVGVAWWFFGRRDRVYG